jgi:hypothetical protein
MIPRQVQNQFRNSKADVQMFYGSGSFYSSTNTTYSWTKPVGVSQVYIMLIGGGAGGNGADAGGSSGNVTTWFGNAQNVPNNLFIVPAPPIGPGFNGGDSTVSYRGTSLNTLLTASGGKSASTNTADVAGTFANSGFYQNVLGQGGSSIGQPASGTTFLSGGGAIAGSSGSIVANYGYSVDGVNNPTGFFMLQPVIVACASANINNDSAPIGCGADQDNSRAGAGFVLIASW